MDITVVVTGKALVSNGY